MKNNFIELEEEKWSLSTAQHLQSHELDPQSTTTHYSPRSITQFRKEALQFATKDAETAASCFYILPQEGHNVEGPGMGLVDIATSCWRNMRYGACILREEEDFVVAQGLAHDLEHHIVITTEVKRRITDKQNRRYGETRLASIGNTACSLALKSAIFKMIPRLFLDVIYDEAKKVAVGNLSTLSTRRQKVFDYFLIKGLTKERILPLLGKREIQEVDLEDLETLIGLKTAIQEGRIHEVLCEM